MSKSSVLVLGNGESRINTIIPNYFKTIIGCNACYRDIPVTDLVCCDKRMVNEVLNSSFEGNIYTRSDWINHYKNFKIKSLPEIPYIGDKRKDQPIHWGSGPYAVLLACKQNYKNIILSGFDLYSDNGLVNNIYKNTTNYKQSTSRAVDPSYWIYQISKIFSIYSNQKNFIIVNQPQWQIPDQWLLPNVSFQNSIDI